MSRKVPDDVDLSIRLKHGIHTIFLSVDPLAPFSDITRDLLEIIQERYPKGLTTSTSPSKTTPVPSSVDEAHVSYALLKNPNDPLQGWRNLNISGSEKPVEKGLKGNCIVAFAIQPAGDADANARFEVEWPKLEEGEEE